MQLTLFDDQLPPSPPVQPQYSLQLTAHIPRVREATGEPIRDAKGFVEVAQGLQELAVECFLAASLSQKNALIDLHLISMGSLTGALVHPREVFRPILLDAGAAVTFLHNHPSGDPAPSRDDREITARLVEAARIIGIRVLDHVVIGHNRYFSFAEEGLL